MILTVILKQLISERHIYQLHVRKSSEDEGKDYIIVPSLQKPNHELHKEWGYYSSPSRLNSKRIIYKI